jgi:hypothetical protein
VSETLQVGDAVEILADVPGRKGLRAGARGVVRVEGLPSLDWCRPPAGGS